MYDGLFSTEISVIFVCSEFEAYSQSCDMFMMESFIHDLV